MNAIAPPDPADTRIRCAWGDSPDPAYRAYHDDEWGVPVRDERHLFELLILEGAQAGLSWSTILRKRDGYRRAFADFDVRAVAAFGDDDTQRLLADAGIVRNRAKVAAAIGNANATLALYDEGLTLVDHESPAWAPSRMSSSNRWRSSRTGTPHSSSW